MAPSLVVVFCLATGFAVSAAVSSLFQLIAAERADFLVDRTTIAGNIVAVLLSMVGGPYILARNAVVGVRDRRISLIPATIMAAVAALWSTCAGIVYLSVMVSS